MQMDLFEDNSDLALLKREVQELRQRQESLRRGIFARHAEIERKLQCALSLKHNKKAEIIPIKERIL